MTLLTGVDLTRGIRIYRRKCNVVFFSDYIPPGQHAAPQHFAYDNNIQILHTHTNVKTFAATHTAENIFFSFTNTTHTEPGPKIACTVELYESV